MTTLGEVLPRLLESCGINTIFGIPGVHTVELYRGLPATRLRHITPRHEQGAGFMADGYARASGRVAACFIISGPGMTNIATAMGQAYADSIPMLVISSVLNRSELGRGEGRLHELKNQSALVTGVAAYSETVMAPESLPGALARAMTVFHSARPRPVHIEIPLDVITADASQLPLTIAPAPARTAPDADALHTAAAWLQQAKTPLLILGGGAVGSPAAARALADALDAPTLLTINAKGLLPPGHPLLVGSLLPQPPVQEALAAADVVLALGTELGETDTLLFGDKPRISGKLIRIDIEAEQLHRNVPANLAILADAGLACSRLADSLDGTLTTPTGAERTHALRTAALCTVPAPYRMHGRVLQRIADALPGVLIVGDSTQPVYGGNLSYDTDQARSWFNSSTGFGTLGYGLPAAFGAKLACPERSVVSLIGDGALLFTIGELATGVELELPVPIILWNNHGYGEIKHYMRERGIPEIGVDIRTPDFQTIAKGFGCAPAHPDSPDALADALQSAAGRDRPTLIEIDDAQAQGW